MISSVKSRRKKKGGGGVGGKKKRIRFVIIGYRLLR